MEEPRCPSCGSNNVQTSTAVVQAGTSHSNISGVGVGIGSGGIGIGVGRGKSESVSETAHLNRDQSNEGCAYVVIISYFVFVVIFTFVGLDFLPTLILPGLIAIGVGIWFASATKDERAKDRAKYAKQWYCHGCGSTFVR